MQVCENDIQKLLDRRRPGQSALTTKRAEADRVSIVSGVDCGVTLGTPIMLLVPNEDAKPGDYDAMADIPRPSVPTFQQAHPLRAYSQCILV